MTQRQKQLIEWTEAIIKITEKWKGQTINVQISLTDRDFDRHGSSFTYFSMVFRSFLMRISGGRLMFDGTNNELVEVAAGNITDVKIIENTEKNEIILMEN